jgi:hypothetical protein
MPTNAVNFFLIRKLAGLVREKKWLAHLSQELGTADQEKIHLPTTNLKSTENVQCVHKRKCPKFTFVKEQQTLKLSFVLPDFLEVLNKML